MNRIKYSCIILWSKITFNTVVDFFGATYVVYGKVVRRIR